MSLLKWYVDLSGNILPELVLVLEDDLMSEQWRSSNYFDTKAYDLITNYNNIKDSIEYNGTKMIYENEYPIDSQIICYFWDDIIYNTGSFISAHNRLEERLD